MSNLEDSFDVLYDFYLRKRIVPRLLDLLKRKGIKLSSLKSCAPSYISKLSSGKISNPSLSKFVSLAKEIDVSVEFLLCEFYKDKPKDNILPKFIPTSSYQQYYETVASKVKEHYSSLKLYFDRTQLTNFSNRRYVNPRLYLFCKIAFQLYGQSSTNKDLQLCLANLLFN